ncbi:MAG: glycosyltransferase [Thermoplasmata archaeon]
MSEAERSETGTAPAVPGLSIVLVTYNERPNLPELVERLRAVSLPAWEAIVVDDGSTDGTREFVEEVAATDPRFRFFYHDGKQTTVRAQSQGILAARGRFVAVLDADLQHPPELLPGMISALERGSSLVVASRYLPGGSPGARTALRGFISRAADAIARAMLSEARRVTDPVSGFFAFRREVFLPLDPGFRGYKLLLFLLVITRGQPVSEVPFRFEPRTAGASKVVGGLGFVRVFLTEVLMAKRIEFALQRGKGPPALARETDA